MHVIGDSLTSELTTVVSKKAVIPLLKLSDVFLTGIEYDISWKNSMNHTQFYEEKNSNCSF